MQHMQIQDDSSANPVVGAGTAVPGLRPREQRTVTLFLLGKLWHQGTDTICRIRNISSGGMRIETSIPLKVKDSVSIETRSGSYLDGQVAWARDCSAGIRFNTTIEHGTLLATPAMQDGKVFAVRAPRFSAAASATMRVDGRTSRVRIANISLSGCAILASVLPPKGRVGELTIAGLPPMKFAPCWSREGLAGLTFIDRLAFDDLARWLVEPARRFALEGGKAPEGHAR